MTLPVDTVWEVQTGGDDSFGGGFSDASKGGTGTDQSQATSAALALTDLAMTTGGATLTSVTGGFDNTMLGNVIQIVSGTNFTAGYYCITGHTDTNTITLDRDATTGSSATGGSGKVGGCLGSPGAAAAVMADGHYCHVKSGSYLLTTTTAGKAGPAVFTSAVAVVMEAYETARGDRGARAFLDCNGYDPTYIIDMVGSDANQQVVIGFDLDGDDQSNCTGVHGTGTTNHDSAINCVSHNCGSYGFQNLTTFECTSHDNNGAGYRITNSINCIAHDNVDAGFSAVANAINCTSYGNTWGFDNPSRRAFYGCIAYNNGSGGFRPSTTGSMSFYACIAVNNTGYGWDVMGESSMFRCADYNNSSGRTNSGDAPIFDLDEPVLTTNPFVDPDNGNFNLNNATGGGAVLMGVEVAL